MILEAINCVAELARDATTPRIVTFPQEPADVYAVAFGKDISYRRAKTKPRNHKAFDLTAIAALAKESDSAEIWYSRTGVVCWLDRVARRDKVSLTLEYSKPMKKLLAWDTSPGECGQKELIHLLRTTFNGCLAEAPALLGQLQKLRWTTSGEVEVSIASGKASVGKKLQAEVQGTGELPDQFTLVVPIFSHPHFNQTDNVVVFLDPNPDDQTFTLTPLAGSVEAAIVAGENELFDRLGEAMGHDIVDVPVLYGRAE